jgi:hypothetical protein
MVASCKVASCKVASCKVASCKVASCKVASCKVASCKVTSCKVASCMGIRVHVIYRYFWEYCNWCKYIGFLLSFIFVSVAMWYLMPAAKTVSCAWDLYFLFRIHSLLPFLLPSIQLSLAHELRVSTIAYEFVLVTAAEYCLGLMGYLISFEDTASMALWYLLPLKCCLWFMKYRYLLPLQNTVFGARDSCFLPRILSLGHEICTGSYFLIVGRQQWFTFST